MIILNKELLARVAPLFLAFIWSLACLPALVHAENDRVPGSDTDDFEVADNPKPDYPSASLLRNESGTAILRVLVNADGTTKQADIEKSSGYSRLDKAALDAVKKWRFRAIDSSQSAKEGWATVPITFSTVNTSSDSGKPAVVLRQAIGWTVDQNNCQLFDYSLQANSTYVWSGVCKNNLIDGRGEVKVIKDGVVISHIEGSYHLGRLEGNANMRTAYQSEYQGPFLHGLKHGQGIQVWKHGLRYEGSFIKNVRTGHGVITYPGDIRYEGEFLNGAPVEKVLIPPKFAFKKQWHLPEEVVSLPKQGSVVIQMWITAEGILKEIEVLQSDHPAYEKEVLRALAEANISPAKLQGKPIPVLFCQKFKFGYSDMQFKPYELELDNPDKLVSIEDEEYSTKPDRLTQFKVPAPLVYPLELFRQSKIGKVSATITIDPHGQVRAVDIRQSTTEEFAEATRAMLMASTFTPATKNLQPIWSKIKLQRTFDRSSGDVFFDKHILRLLGKIRDNESDIFKLADLDRKPMPIFHPLPVVPVDYSLKQDEKVMLSFYIDKTGRVQLPQVLKTNYPALGWLAMTAVSRWQFEPPTVKGEPVDVTVNLPIVFSASAVINHTN